MNDLTLKLGLSFMIFLLMFTSITFAIPGIPHQFYGDVKINGNPAPDGTQIVAKIGNNVVGTTTTLNGKYGYAPNVFLIADPNGDYTGKTIYFYVNNKLAITYPFQNGGNTKLDLSITTSEGGGTSGGTGGGGTTGGGGGGVTIETHEETNITQETEMQTQGNESQCIEKWVCTPWSECKNGVQTRTCTEVNNCGTDIHKPFETQPCTLIQGEEGETTNKTTGLGGNQTIGLGGITGFIVSNPAPIFGGIFAVMVILAILIYWKALH